MRSWLVAGALVERDGELLLVCNRRRDGRTDWTPPGGVIDDGEALMEGLAREVDEETGLQIVDWADDAAYRIGVEAPDLGWHLEVEVHRATAWRGVLSVGDDPDGIVVDARFLDVVGCEAQLRGAHRWVAEPLCAWLSGALAGGSRFDYRIDGGADPTRRMSVERL